MVLAITAAVILTYMLGLWLLSIPKGDPSFVDAGWGYGFVVAALTAWLASDGDGDPTRRTLLLAVTAAWGVRLGTYLLWRWRRDGPDARYRAMLRAAGGNPHVFTLTKVFLLQGALMWIVSLPLQTGMTAGGGTTATMVLGVVISLTGLAFESIGDAQLVAFKADPANAGRVLDSGLWRYTRHPNYFGDALVWWGLYLTAVGDLPSALAIIGPIVMTVLLLRYSGVPLLERGLVRRRPGYEDYIARTSAFVPRPPRSPRSSRD